MSGYLLTNKRAYTDTTDVLTALSEGLLCKTVVGSQEHYECRVCSRSMAGVVPAEAHLKGAPHFKALRNYMHAAPLSEAFIRLGVSEQSYSSSDTPLLQPTNCDRMFGSRESETDKGPLLSAKERNIVTSTMVNGIVHMTCNVCRITCTGEEPMIQHLKGDRHNKRMRGMAHLQDNVCMNNDESLQAHRTFPIQSLPSSSLGNEFEDVLKIALSSGIVTSDSGRAESMTCNLCLKSCTGSVPMKAHLEGQAHMKKARLHGTPPVTRTCQNTFSSISIESNNRMSNEVPVIDLQEPNSQHVFTPGVQSQEHIKEYTQTNSVEDAKARGFVIEVEGSLMCLICSSICTGLMQMSDHLLGVDHRKKYKDHIEYELLFEQQYSPADITPILNVATSRPSINDLTKNEPLQPGASAINVRKVQDAAFAQYKSAPHPFKKQRVSPDIPSHHDSQNSLYNTGIKQQRQHKLVLPENLCHLEVYFPDDPIGRLM